jgi:hypothetical protein
LLLRFLPPPDILLYRIRLGFLPLAAFLGGSILSLVLAFPTLPLFNRLTFLGVLNRRTAPLVALFLPFSALRYPWPVVITALAYLVALLTLTTLALLIAFTLFPDCRWPHQDDFPLAIPHSRATRPIRVVDFDNAVHDYRSLNDPLNVIHFDTVVDYPIIDDRVVRHISGRAY